ncbi:hypothetical protein AVEN_166584-1, partial [Araneus ventricosus]
MCFGCKLKVFSFLISDISIVLLLKPESLRPATTPCKQNNSHWNSSAGSLLPITATADLSKGVLSPEVAPPFLSEPTSRSENPLSIRFFSSTYSWNQAKV